MASRLDSLTKLAFCDELVKISRSAEQEANRQKAKKFVKNTLLISSGMAAGTGLAMIAEDVAKRWAGPAWDRMPVQKRISILGPIVSAGSIAAPLLIKKLMEEKARREKA